MRFETVNIFEINLNMEIISFREDYLTITEHSSGQLTSKGDNYDNTDVIIRGPLCPVLLLLFNNVGYLIM